MLQKLLVYPNQLLILQRQIKNQNIAWLITHNFLNLQCEAPESGTKLHIHIKK